MRDRLMRKALREKFIVSLRGGEAFEGLLVEADSKTFVLVNAWAIDGSNRVSVDGQLYLPRAEVMYMQRVGGQA